ncbi:hypothetical protein JXA84_03150 [candidate division WOR-3 bacterium]|nr:hypothetical protein [candidate division WOR-3 bacterium]
MKTFIISLSILFWIKISAVDYPDTFKFVEVPDPLSGSNLPHLLIPRPCPLVGETIVNYHFGKIQVRSTQIEGISGKHE